jgi:hypothetical protein
MVPELLDTYLCTYSSGVHISSYTDEQQEVIIIRELHIICYFMNCMRWARSNRDWMEFERRFPHFVSDVFSALFRMDIECLSNWYVDGRIK